MSESTTKGIWVSVDDRLPEKRAPMFKHYILAVDLRGRMSVGYVWENGTWTFAKPIGEPRYWMELPDRPALIGA